MPYGLCRNFDGTGGSTLFHEKGVAISLWITPFSRSHYVSWYSWFELIVLYPSKQST